MSEGWIAVDLDGTLAHYDERVSEEHIGLPVPAMLARVKKWLSEGRDVRIFTARVDGGEVALVMGNPAGEAFKHVSAIRATIDAWCKEHIGQSLPITNQKDYGMVECWDDRAVQVVPNTGQPISARVVELEQVLEAWREWCRKALDAGFVKSMPGNEIPWGE